MSSRPHLGRGIVAGINFLFLNTVAAISMAILMKGLKISSQKEKEAVQLIKEESIELSKAKKYLEEEMVRHTKRCKSVGS